MIKAITTFIILLLLTTGAARAQFIKAELQINGINCALCATATTKQLKALPFINDVKADLIRNTYLITFKSGEQVDFDLLGKKVKDQGFFVSVLKATFNFSNVKVADNCFSYAGDTFQLMNASKTPEGIAELTIVDRGLAPKSVSKKYLGKIAEVNNTATGRLYHVAI